MGGREISKELSRGKGGNATPNSEGGEAEIVAHGEENFIFKH